MTHACDVVIVGAGIVGAALALSLRDSGLSLALVEPQAPVVPETDWDSRIYAISPGSEAFLRSMGVWQTFDASRIGPVYGMEIRGDSGALLSFDAYREGLPQLAWIMESNRIQHGLWTALQQQANLTIFSARTRQLSWSAAAGYLQLDDGTEIAAKLIVAADGGQSWVRSQAGIGSQCEPYRQYGVVANFAVERAHGGIARQWFREDGVLAWLPLPGRHISIVWGTDDAHTQVLLAANPQDFADEVARAGNRTLGELRQTGVTAAFPLSLNRVDALVKPRLALIGDAAHSVHPLAGQGVNLGLRDAQSLSRVLLGRGGADCGELALLRRYERSRGGDIAAIQTVTDGLHRLFRHRHPWVGILRNAGMGWTNRIGPLKSLLIRQALG
ncbi:MAG: UbiH/UbiF family hydroxylase [Burkholderiales bacterium]